MAILCNNAHWCYIRVIVYETLVLTKCMSGVHLSVPNDGIKRLDPPQVPFTIYPNLPVLYNTVCHTTPGAR